MEAVAPDDLESGVDGLIDDVRAWHRVRKPGMLEPVALLGRVTGILLGARQDGAGGRLELCPDLPAGWKSLKVKRLRSHRTLLDLEVRPRAEWVTVRLAVRFGPAIPVRVSLPDTLLVSRVTVDEVPLESHQAILTLQGEHEILFYLGAPGRGEVG